MTNASFAALVLLLAACGSSQPAGTSHADMSAPVTGDVECSVFTYCSCLDGTDTGFVCDGSCAVACEGHGGAEPAGTCAPGTTACGEECANLQIDGNNCGACNHPCTEYTDCVAGACKVALPSNQSFSCRADSDCAAGEACVLNTNANCTSPFCARPCEADGGTCASGACGAAIDTGTSAPLSACIQSNDCS